MATVSGTLKLFDAMTGPLKKITQSMNIMISTMHDMESATKGNIQIDKMLGVAKQQLALAEAEINSAISKSTQEQNKFNKAASGSSISFGKIIGHVFAINEGLELMRQIWGGITSAMERADEVLGVQARLSLVNDGLQTQAELQQKILKTANETRSSYRDTADTVAKLGLFAPNLFKTNDKLVGFAETLNKLFVASGAGTVERQTALLQLGQALSSGVLQGDELRSISEAAPLFMDQLAKGIGVARGELKGMGADGKLTADVVVKAIQKQEKEIDKLFQKMPMTFGGALTIMGNKLDDWLGKMYEAGGPLRYLTSQMEGLIAWMDSDRGAAFFSGMTVALNALIMSITLFGNIIGTILNFVIDHGAEITGMLLVWGVTYIPMLTMRLWGLIPPILAATKAFLLANWPVLLIVAAVGLLIYILRQFGVTTDQIIGFVAGVFFALFASINNHVALLWNTLVSFAEFFANLFVDPVYAIQKLFYDMFKNVSDYFTNWANHLVNVLNWIISKINEVSGTTIQAIAKVNNAWLEAMKPQSSKNVFDFSEYKMQQKNIGEAFKSGYKWGEGSLSKLTGMAQPLGPAVPSAMDKMSKIDKVGEVGKIKDKVDISSEDLKTMRELAEMKNIQNFVTLQPQLTFGDTHVRQDGRSIDEIVANISSRLEEEIASSARMVLNV